MIKGERIGRLKLGGQTVLVLPDMHINTKIGEYVVAGETVIAEKWKSE